MSAPDNNGSKAPPSLLSDSAHGAADNGSRILASLEGRVPVGQPRARAHASRKPLYAALAAALVGISAFGAWQWQRSGDDDAAGRPAAAVVHEAGHDAGHAGAAPTATNAASAVTLRPAADATVASASAANVSGASAPGKVAAAVATPGVATPGVATPGTSAPQPAVIIADDSPAPAPAAASGAQAAHTGDAGRLARALTDGMPAGKSSAAPAAAKHANAGGHESTKRAAVESKAAAHGSSAAAPHDAKTHRDDSRLAAKHATQKQAKARQNDDPDADLLAVLIARTKPYEQKQAKGTASAGASAKVAPAEKERKATLAEQVAECDKNGFFKGQICRWRVCSGRWGTDPSCPSSAQTSSPSSANVATQSQ